MSATITITCECGREHIISPGALLQRKKRNLSPEAREKKRRVLAETLRRKREAATTQEGSK